LKERLIAVDLQKEIAHITHALEEIFDRIKYRQVNGTRPLTIIPYIGFGSAKFIKLKGRVIEDTGIKPSHESDRIWNNLLNMYRRFESDEVPNARLLARYQNIEQLISANEEGYFEVIFHFDQPLVSHCSWQNVELELLDPGREKVIAKGQALIVLPQAEFGVISDIDDTVVHTGVTSRFKMFYTVLLKNARTRLPLKGVARFYKNLQQGSSEEGCNPLFYVSSSPWNMYDLFREFFQINDIPFGPIFLRDWGFERHSMVAENNRKYKLNSIFTILDSFPELKFILIGDSGEEDPEIYLQVIQTYPQRILTAYIRCVKRDPKRRDEIYHLAQRANKLGTSLVLVENTKEMEVHAAQQGWISLSPVSQPGE
jgi:phosphatidate phosphatase APP1